MLVVWAVVGAVVGAVFASGAAAADETAHPQDGPHAELRLTVTDEGLRLGVGLNLAFIDEVIPPAREAQGQVIGGERDALLEAVKRWLVSEVDVTLDGQAVEPRFDSVHLFADPDPAMSAIYPTYGPRALIRTTATLVFESANPERMTMTWPAYPKDMLNAAMEDIAVDEAPSLFLEAQFRAGGSPVRIIRFSEAEPTFEWSASEETQDADSLPAPPVEREVHTPGRGGGVLQVVGLAAMLLGLVLACIRKARAFGALLLVLGFAGVMLIGDGRTEMVSPTISDQQAREVFATLHERMYRAFDYTAESEIYDALSRAVTGPLLEETYTELYSMLLQTEQEGLVGVVTGIEPIETAIDKAGRERPAFGVRSRWRVRGTVYHWGHTHTREHEYEAAFEIAPVKGEWRIVERRILSQTRVGEPTDSVPGEL